MIVDYLIIGQGIAGSLLAWELKQAGASFSVIDQDYTQSSSFVAEGVLNPIRGKRFTLVDGFDAFYDNAVNTYQHIEQQLSFHFFSPCPIVRILTSPKHVSEWKHNQTYVDWITENIPNSLHQNIHDPYGSITINKSARCQTSTFLKKIQQWLINERQMHIETFDYNKLIINNNQITYNNITAKKIIFCEGFRVINNPWFNHLPYNMAKGEILTVNPHKPLPIDAIYRADKQIVPRDNGLYSTGSTYHWNDLTNTISHDGCEEIITSLCQTFKTEFNIIEQNASVRPILKDRMPVIGAHPNHSNIYILNGFASHGWLCGPTYAKHLANHLLNGHQIPPTYSINRFNK